MNDHLIREKIEQVQKQNKLIKEVKEKNKPNQNILIFFLIFS